MALHQKAPCGCFGSYKIAGGLHGVFADMLASSMQIPQPATTHEPVGGKPLTEGSDCDK